ncbi:hypothetical protein ACFWXK_30185 [Streptomyces sp. NPDC059070]|uniref:hypothetical protein n=1 Tax=unclassified Streptomyces TaxID=2593676 RepID=UPI0034E1E37B
MNTKLLEATTAARIRVNGWLATTASALRRRGDRGQGAVEYMGIIIVVVGIILVLTQTNVGSAIAGKITAAINRINP